MEAIAQDPEIQQLLQQIQKHPDIAGSLNNLGGLYKVQGKYKKAKPI